VRYSQESHVLNAKTLIRYLESYQSTAQEVDTDKSERMRERRERVKILKPNTEINKLRGTFNIIGEKVSSQVEAANRLLHTISQTISTNDSHLIQHALYTISLSAITHCQSNHFNPSKHAASYASVISTLCAQSSVINELIRAQFFKHCPLIIPILAPDIQCDEIEYYKLMGYKNKTTNQGDIEWESTEKWSERVMKLLGTFVYIAIGEREGERERERGICLINPLLEDKPSSNNVMQVRGRKERREFADSFQEIYCMRLLYPSTGGYMYPIRGLLARKDVYNPYVAYSQELGGGSEKYEAIAAFPVKERKAPDISEISNLFTSNKRK